MPTRHEFCEGLSLNWVNSLLLCGARRRRCNSCMTSNIQTKHKQKHRQKHRRIKTLIKTLFRATAGKGGNHWRKQTFKHRACRGRKSKQICLLTVSRWWISTLLGRVSALLRRVSTLLWRVSALLRRVTGRRIAGRRIAGASRRSTAVGARRAKSMARRRGSCTKKREKNKRERDRQGE